MRTQIKAVLRRVPFAVWGYRKAVAAATAARGATWRHLGFRREFEEFRRASLLMDNRFDVRWRDRSPYFGENTTGHGYDRHYVYHTAWAARVLAQTRPPEHVDISSHIEFVTLVSAFVPIRFYEYRPVDLRLSQLSSGQADLCSLPFGDKTVTSLSCLHVVEHVGLGRYGDVLDPRGDVRAFSELKRVLAPGGSLLIAVPVGQPRLMFNAHRVYSYDQVAGCFSDLTLKEFTLIPDRSADGHLVAGASPAMANAQSYGCGCFWFQRR